MKLRLNDVSVSFGDNTVLSHINFEVNGNDKVAIVGRNGCGKTTLLNVILGLQEIDETNEKQHIEKTGNFKIGHLKQIAFDDDFCSLNDEILKVYKPILQIRQFLINIFVFVKNLIVWVDIHIKKNSINRSSNLVFQKKIKVKRLASSQVGNKQKLHLLNFF